MKATYDPTAPTSWTTSHRKEGKVYFHSYQVVSLAAKPWNDGRQPTAIDARIYGTNTGNTCCLWVHATPSKNYPDGLHTQGSARAGGYGYHRPSAALGSAIRAAGFTLDQSINGDGESAMREALLAIAKAVGIARPVIVESFQ